MADIIDTRELQERYRELEFKIEVAVSAWMDDTEASAEDQPDSSDVLDADELQDWIELSAMEDNISDFWYGETLVNDDYFTEYAEELAKDICGFSTDAGWPYSHIDWEAAADALKVDYAEYEWQGETYLAR